MLDEEQFANRLIPELFKHNNYASFVRQLNMYGFHKRVGLTDNSMRASERKAKVPSEYENEFFKRGRPDLLWLIAKPKPPASKARNRKSREDDDAASDDSDQREVGEARSNTTGAMGGPSRKLDLVTLPRSQLVSFQSEIEQLRKSQQHINSMIARFQHENNAYIRQASAQHERHEHSINAILQFLATFYSRSQDSGAMPNMFQMPIPDNQPQGNVREMGDFEEQNQAEAATSTSRQTRRPLALLPPPTLAEARVRSATPETTPQRTPKQATSLQQQHISRNQADASQTAEQRRNSQRQASAASEIDDNRTETPATREANSSRSQDQQQFMQQSDRPSQTPNSATAQNQPSNNDMLAIINSSNNATSNSQPADFDFFTALRNFENNGSGPLTSEQRENMLSMMASNSGASTPRFANGKLPSNATGAANQNLNTSLQGQNTTMNPSTNALLYAPLTPPTTISNPTADLSLQNYTSSQQSHLAHLQRLQREQDNKVADLTTRLQPLSPSGSIPGLMGASSSPVPSLNMGSFGMDDDGGGGNTFNFDHWLAGGQDYGSGGNYPFEEDSNETFGLSGWSPHAADGEAPPNAAAGLVDPDAGFGAGGGYFGDVELRAQSSPRDEGAGGLFADNTDIEGSNSRNKDDGRSTQNLSAMEPEHEGGHPDQSKHKHTTTDEGGRIIGSVSNSEGARTPVARVEDFEEEGEPDAGLRRSKRRRVGA